MRTTFIPTNWWLALTRERRIECPCFTRMRRNVGQRQKPFAVGMCQERRAVQARRSACDVLVKCSRARTYVRYVPCGNVCIVCFARWLWLRGGLCVAGGAQPVQTHRSTNSAARAKAVDYCLCAPNGNNNVETAATPSPRPHCGFGCQRQRLR